jgi:hypothetical protein
MGNPGKISATKSDSALRIAWSMIPKSMPSVFDPTGGNWFSEKMMLEGKSELGLPDSSLVYRVDG